MTADRLGASTAPGRVVDLHQDLLLHETRPELYAHLGQTGFADIAACRLHAVVAPAWPEPADRDYFGPSIPSLIDEALAGYKTRAADLGWTVVEGATDLTSPPSGVRLVLHIEGLNVLPDDPTAALERWRAAGVRSLGLTWNASNAFAGGCREPQHGLTARGRDVISWAARRGVAVDLAHLAEASFWDALSIIDHPPWVSHAAAAELTRSPRNLTDDQLAAVAANDGVVGVALVPAFLTGGRAALADVVRQMAYIADLIGVRHLALGSDFGGITGDLVEGC